MSELNVSQFLATRLRAACDALCEACAVMPGEAFVRPPGGAGAPGRSMADLVAECVSLNVWAAQAFRSRAAPGGLPAVPEPIADPDEAAIALMQAANALAMAVAGFPEHLWGTHTVTVQSV